MPKPTAREILEGQLEHRRNAAALLDAYRAQVLTEAARLIVSTSRARLDAVSEEDEKPSDWDRHREWLDAADVLLAAAADGPRPA